MALMAHPDNDDAAASVVDRAPHGEGGEDGAAGGTLAALRGPGRESEPGSAQRASASADSAPLSPERQRQLQSYLDWGHGRAAHSQETGPFHGVALQEADLSWLAARVRTTSGSVPDLDLAGAELGGMQLAGVALREVHLEGANLGGAELAGADLRGAHLERAALGTAHLEEADLRGAHLEEAYLGDAYLEGALLDDADLAGATLRGAHLEGASLAGAYLAQTDLRGAFVAVATDLSAVTLADPHRVGPQLADLHWGSANLVVVEWEPVRILGDEAVARQSRVRRAGTRRAGRRKAQRDRVREFQMAGRAYRLVAVPLRTQGLSSQAARFHYRAEVMDRKAVWHQLRRKPWRLGRWFFSWLLGTFAGYGDYVGRLFATYAVIVTLFALAFWWGAHPTVALPASLRDVVDPFVLSVTSFHGRGLLPAGLTQNDTVTALSGLEAMVGLVVEGLFIATFTRRLTGG
jgi:uncharacterized protein YjbI with pentapeptide repeats